MKTEKGIYTKLGDYKVVKLLGDGQTCKVKLGEHTKTGEFHALKILKGKNPLKNEAQNEIKLLQALKHENIIRLFDLQVDAIQTKPSGKQSKKTFLALELAHGQDLFDFVAETGCFEDQLCRYYFKQLLEALKYTHSKNYCHRDLKPANILLSGDYQLKLADFGYSSCLEGSGDKSGQSMLTTMVGTQGYMAPEIVDDSAYTGVGVDLFAASVILFVMRSQQPPWVQASQKDAYYKRFLKNPKKFWKFNSNNKPGKKSYYDEDFKDLINQMFKYNPEERLNVDQLLDHKYLKGETYSKEQVMKIVEERLQKHFDIKESELETLKLNVEIAQTQSHKFRSIRDLNLPKDQLEALEIIDDYKVLEKMFPTIKNERDLYAYPKICKSMNVHFIQAAVQDAFEFLVCVLNHNKKGCDSVVIDDEDFVIQASFLLKDEEVKMMISFFDYTEKEGSCAIEFKRVKGSPSEYSKQVKMISQRFLSILDVSNQDQKTQKTSKVEESKNDE